MGLPGRWGQTHQSVKDAEQSHIGNGQDFSTLSA